jgi:hypothetical protein
MDELRELRDIAVREHGPQARSTRIIEEALGKETASREGRAAPEEDRCSQKPR